MLKELDESTNKMELGLGWLRAVAQGYNYNNNKLKLMAARGGAMLQLQLQYNLIRELLSNEFKSFGNQIKLGLGWLRAVAQGYKYSYNKIKLANNFQRNLMSWQVTFSWGLDGCVRLRKDINTIAIQLHWGVMAARGGARLHVQLQ